MEFRILGPLEVHDGAAPVAIPGVRERALPVDLLVHAGGVVPADRLIEDLWGDDPPGNPGNALQGRVSALRPALGPAGAALLVTRPPGYALEVEPERVDAARFERLVAEAGRVPAAEQGGAAGLLEQALGLWRGPALAEFADLPFARAEAARLEELRLGALDDAEAHLREAATLIAGRPQPATEALVLVGFAWAALGRGDAGRAALLLGAAGATRERIGVAPVGAERREAVLARQAARSRLGERAFQAATAAGRDLPADQALRVALQSNR
jgi:hypothetical protein